VGPDHVDVELAEPGAAMHNGDGITWWDRQGELNGVPVNRVQPLDQPPAARWRLWPNQPPAALKDLRAHTALWRNRDMAWDRQLARRSAERHIGCALRLDERPGGLRLTITDEDGHRALAEATLALQPADDATRAEAALRTGLAKLGGTVFAARGLVLALSQPWFVPASAINALRREAVAALEAARAAARQRLPRAQPVSPPPPCPDAALSYLANVYNHRARDFYARHGVQLIDAAYESHQWLGEASLMITKHCVRYSLSLCPKQAKGVLGVQGTVRAEPLTLRHGDDTLQLRFDCKACEMHVVGRLRKNVLQQAKAEPVTFYRSRPRPPGRSTPA
jgi:putative protease